MNGSGAIGMPHRRPGGRTALREVSFLCLWCLLPAWSAQGAYKNLAVKVGPVEGYASRQSQGPVTIAADPHPSETRIRTAFDIKGLSKMGLLPINLIVSNQGPDSLSIDVESITLLDPEYGSLQALSPREVVGMLLRQDRRNRRPLGRVFPCQGQALAWPGGAAWKNRLLEIRGRPHSKITQAPRPPPSHRLGVCLLPASGEKVAPDWL